MSPFWKINSRLLPLLLAVSLIGLPAAAAGAQRPAVLRGQITDQLGGAIVGAPVTVTGSSGKEQTIQTDERGIYRFSGLIPGAYNLRVVAAGFAAYEKSGLNLVEGQTQTLDFSLKATVENQKVTVTGERLDLDPGSNKSALVIQGQDLDALPEDPAELAASLTALAGPAAGPNGADVYIDGFTAGQNLPDKQSIRQIVINRNPFSAEFDRIGFGRIEIFTKPGAGKLHGGASLLFNNQVLNSRNPYAANRADFLRMPFFLNLNGPLLRNKASFFFGAARRTIDDNAVINSTILDSNLNVASFSQSLTTPKRYTEVYPRVDLQVGKTTMSVRYNFNLSIMQKQGIGGFSLLSQGFGSADRDQSVQLTATSILSARAVNDAAFQFERYTRRQTAEGSGPSLVVLEAFSGGGSPAGNSFLRRDEWELRDYMTMTYGRHTLKFGGRLRGYRLSDVSPTNFQGTYIFAGGSAPLLDGANQPVIGPDGKPAFGDVSSIERYRRTLLFQRLGLEPSAIRVLGGGPAQLTLAGGNPAVGLKQIDFGGFAQDDWKLRPDFTLSLGIRYQNQTNLRNNLNFAPRAAFAWTPWANGNGQPKTVIRGGVGVFYDYIGTNLTTQAIRFNGINQSQFIVTDPPVLDLFPRVPSTVTLVGMQHAQTIWRKASDLIAPYTIQSAISLERTLPHNITLTTTYLDTRGLHQLRARNINAPLPGTFKPGSAGSGVRPFGIEDNIYEYESAGIYKQHLLMLNANIRPSAKLSLFANYAFGRASSNTDGAGTFPADSYDLSNEYGRTSYDVRHRVTLGGTINMWWGISLNPFVIASTGAPFNITTGIDGNGDSLFTDRPAFASSPNGPSVKTTPFGAFDLAPAPGEKIIPRNFGQGPGYFVVNMGFSKTIGLGHEAKAPQANAAQAGGGSRPENRPYRLILSTYVVNLFNRTNRGTPIGNLTSSLFGTANSLNNFRFGIAGNNAYNRAVNLNVSFNF